MTYLGFVSANCACLSHGGKSTVHKQDQTILLGKFFSHATCLRAICTLRQ